MNKGINLKRNNNKERINVLNEAERKKKQFSEEMNVEKRE